MDLRLPRSKHKAISPVLATVILIAITLIAAIAIAGFVFGLFGSFTKTATVTASVVSCGATPEVANPVCTLTLNNSGTASATVITGSITYGGSTSTGVHTAWSGGVLTAGTNTPGTITFTDTNVPSTGEAFTGSLSLSNGAAIPFTGNFL